MSREELTIELRRHQLVNEDGNVVVQCNPDGTAEYVPGTVDDSWLDVTTLTEGLEKLDLSWDAVNSGASGDPNLSVNEAGTNYDKGLSAELTFHDAAFQFIYDWLLDSMCGTLNRVDVRITDQLCRRKYRIFEIKADNLGYKPYDAPCEFVVNLREADPVWHCVHKTFIWDNWQEWFLDGGSKQHPCFLTAVEPRPRLIASARMGLSIFGQTIPVISAFFDENDNVFRRILNVDNFVDAPLVRDIISNVCDKCGLDVDTLFHDEDSPYHNLCLFNPCAGVWHTNDSDGVTSPALWFHLENRWNITLAEFLDKLKPVFDAEWYVTPNSTLVFRNKTDFLNLAPILDFVASDLNIWELEYTFIGDKKPAYGRYQYTPDASDLASQEVQNIYNDIVDFDGPTDNLMLEGNVSMLVEFAPTGFVRDGKARGDYMRDLINDGETVAYAILVLLGVITASLLAGVLSAGAGAALAIFIGIWVINIANKASDLRGTFGSATYTGAVRITSDQVGTPRLILWDGLSLNRAKVVKVDPDDIVPAAFYNPDLDSWTDLNTVQYNPVGGLFVFNYPMYFDSMFEGNLFDRFHDALDNPLKSADSNQLFEFYTDRCCQVLDALGVWEGDFARIGYQVVIEQRANYQVNGRIEHMEVSYEDDRVRLRGRVIKKPL